MRPGDRPDEFGEATEEQQIVILDAAWPAVWRHLGSIQCLLVTRPRTARAIMYQTQTLESAARLAACRPRPAKVAPPPRLSLVQPRVIPRR